MCNTKLTTTFQSSQEIPMITIRTMPVSRQNGTTTSTDLETASTKQSDAMPQVEMTCVLPPTTFASIKSKISMTSTLAGMNTICENWYRIRFPMATGPTISTHQLSKKPSDPIKTTLVLRGQSAPHSPTPETTIENRARSRRYKRC